MPSPPQPTSLPRSWLLHSRTFWLGLLVFIFFIWLTVDSHLNMSIIRTIHRGSWRDWSNETTIPAGTPAESGSLMLMLSQGAIGVRWLDQMTWPGAAYGGDDERGKPYPGISTIWLPKVVNERDSVMRYRGVQVPTWIPLAGWLGIWAWQLARSKRRHRAFLPPAAPLAS